jgi:hypothetical protein
VTEIPPEAAALLQAIYGTLRGSDDPAAEQAALALVPIMGRVRCHLPVRADDCANAADLLDHRAVAA